MDMDYLTYPYNSLPLERESEGWIISQIERYFEVLGRHCKVAALSPKKEKSYGIDEILELDGEFKVIGLQFKRTYINEGKNDLGSVFWKLNEQQDKIIRKLGFVHYCLPIFTSPAYKTKALGLSKFWRPSSNQTFKTNTKYNDIINNMLNWSNFINKLNQCKIGLETNNISLNREIILNDLGINDETIEDLKKLSNLNSDLNTNKTKTTIADNETVYLAAISI